ncbi:phage tail tube protein [uncultured Oxalobacter sp.]|uniref:phage tail tube protein n=1 Tax=uncultured Oxalobacter sp. TaxID=337245 RepID=UPI002599576A|nr:phage tail tube protein [uncultured Oxalobacter sp.]
MAKRMRNALILAKTETTYGVDPTPTGAANAILCSGISPNMMSAEFVDRDLQRPYLGASEQLLASVKSELEFDVELTGSGTAGVAPAWGPLLKACAFGETVTESTDVVYKPVTDNIPSVTIFYYLDGLLHKMSGCRGTVSFELSPKGIPKMKFKFTGKYTEPTDTSNPSSVDYSAFQVPKVASTLNTPVWSLHGQTAPMSEFSVDVANDVIYRELIGASSVEITNRKPTGSVTFELNSIATKNWYQTIADGDTGAVSMTHGTVAGNIVVISAPKAQIYSPSYKDEDGNAMLSVSLSLIPDEGNDEISITVK